MCPKGHRKEALSIFFPSSDAWGEHRHPWAEEIGDSDMAAIPSSDKPARRLLTARRLVLLASVAGLGTAVLFSGPGGQPVLPGWSSASAQVRATDAARPVGFADIVERVRPAVIGVRVKNEALSQRMQFFDEDLPFPPGSPFERFFRRFGPGMPDGVRPRRFSIAQGSGFFISPDGYAVTNYHVVERGQNIEIQTDDGKTYAAKVVGTDPKTDLALLKVDGRTDFPYVRFADKQPRIGDWVIAVGNPFGLGGTVTAGIVSARGRDIGAGPYDDFIQIDAPVNKGNSGGPTFDVDGNVIGVNTAIFSPNGGSVGIGFAIPAETVKTVVAQLKEHGTVTRGWIGVQIQPVTRDIADSLGLKEPEGALVAETQPDSPAAKAGIISGDVIVSVNNERVANARELARKIAAQAPGSEVKIGLIRRGEERTVTVTLGELPRERQARVSGRDGGEGPQLGLQLAPAGRVAGSGDQGVVVLGVDPDGPAAEQGFRTGDVILEVAGQTVSTPADVRKALAEARAAGKRTVLMRVRSGETTKFVALPLGRA
jgi:serine protease Do